jgi:type I restriction enzyme S subunit
MSWEIVQLDSIFKIARGGSPRPINDYLTEDTDGVNWIMIGDTETGEKYINSAAKRIKKDGVSKSRFVQKGDFLLTNSMSFGRPYILNIDGCIHDGWLVLSPINENLTTDYFYHYLGSDEIKSRLASMASGAVVKNLNKDIVSSLKIPLPPLGEQKKIAAILDAADEYRQKTKALIEKYDQLTESLFLDMFGDPVTNPKGWRTAHLGEIMISKTGSVNPINYPDELFEYFSIPAFDKGQSEMTYGSSIGSSKKRFQPGDVLLSRIVPHIRRCWIVPENHGYRQIGSGEWIVFKSGDVNPNFLRFYLTTDFFHAQFMKTIKGVGGSLMRADIGQVKLLKFYTPPMDVQLEFSKMVVKIDNQKQKAEASLVKAEELFNSLLQRAFKGDLTN